MNSLQHSTTKIVFSSLVVLYHVSTLIGMNQPSLVYAIHDKLHNFKIMEKKIDKKVLKLQSTYKKIKNLGGITSFGDVKLVTSKIDSDEKDLSRLFNILEKAYSYFYHKLVSCQKACTDLHDGYDFKQDESVGEALLAPCKALAANNNYFEIRYPTIHTFLTKYQQLFKKINDALSEFREHRRILCIYAKAHARKA